MNWKFHSPTIVQGIAQPHVLSYISTMKSHGSDLVAGISGGQKVVTTKEIPIFNLVEDAIEAMGQIETSIIFADPYQVLDVSLEAIASGVKQLIIITPNVPPLDTIELLKSAKINKISILGPGSSGLIIPDKCCLGTLEQKYFCPGNVGIIGYGKLLIYEVIWELKSAEIGQSLAISLGKDQITCSNLVSWLKILNEDDSTEVIVLIQLAQDIDYDALKLLAKSTTKPVICYVAGSQTPADKLFRDGVAILKNHLSNSIPASDSYKKMISTIKKSGAIVANKPSEIPQLVEQVLSVKK